MKGVAHLEGSALTGVVGEGPALPEQKTGTEPPELPFPTERHLPTPGSKNQAGPSVRDVQRSEVKKSSKPRRVGVDDTLLARLNEAFTVFPPQTAERLGNECWRLMHQGRHKALAKHLQQLSDIPEADVPADTQRLLTGLAKTIRRQAPKTEQRAPDFTPETSKSDPLPNPCYTLNVDPFRLAFLVPPAQAATRDFVNGAVADATNGVCSAANGDEVLAALEALQSKLETLPIHQSYLQEGRASLRDAFRDLPLPGEELLEALSNPARGSAEEASAILDRMKSLFHDAGTFAPTELGKLQAELAHRLTQSPGRTSSSHYLSPAHARIPDAGDGGHVVYLASGPDVFTPLVNWPKAEDYHLADLWDGWGKGPSDTASVVEQRLRGLGEVTVEQTGWLAGRDDDDLATTRAYGPVVYRVEIETEQGPMTKRFHLHTHDLNNTEHTDDLMSQIPAGELSGGVLKGVSRSLPSHVQESMRERLRPQGSVLLSEVPLDRKDLPDWKIRPGNFLVSFDSFTDQAYPKTSLTYGGQQSALQAPYFILERPDAQATSP